MPLFQAALLFLVLATPSQGTNSQHVDCSAWQTCRQLAVDAAGRQDFETFHDLAWRAVQLGPRNNPELMYLLARAQSLSGRPGDALVMLQRLVHAGVPVDAASNDDFRRVRALPGWKDLEAKISALPRAAAPDAAKPEGVKTGAVTAPNPASARVAASEAPKADKGTAPAAEASNSLPPSGSSAPRPGSASAAAPSSPSLPAESSESIATSRTYAVESLRFTTTRFIPGGLAYDAVSRRFVVGDRLGRKLAVVDEFSRHVANLAGSLSSGFGEIAALEIDTRQGDLWVVSSDGGSTTLHKLQLISGRLLAAYPLPARFAPVSFGDVAVTPASTVLALDTTGHRIFRLRPRATTTELAMTLPDAGPLSVAPADENIVYVSGSAGIARVDFAAQSTVPLKPASGVDLRGLARIRWYQGSLVGIQKTSDAVWRAVRITLDRSGRTATAVHVLDPRLSTADPTAATVSGGVLYYLASGEGTEMIVRRVPLK